MGRQRNADLPALTPGQAAQLARGSGGLVPATRLLAVRKHC